jgi:hypothetical protein
LKGRWNSNDRLGQRHQAATHPLLANVNSESVQAAIQRLFDASIMLEDVFRDFVGASCKLSLETVEWH